MKKGWRWWMQPWDMSRLRGGREVREEEEKKEGGGFANKMDRDGGSHYRARGFTSGLGGRREREVAEEKEERERRVMDKDDSAMNLKTPSSKEGSNVIEEIIDREEKEDEELNDEDHNDDMEDNFLGL
ncbi:hypothetical protein COCNU_03G006250 [Cocos nucifera]|uniref:Uncharacterized protein n=1 Tax=Cocos nucifera TaxID=13894 RepID=A0A8K0I366_COCNU|nr:hypothetical protein COCNU_03G006250 [Cocos nucifera]